MWALRQLILADFYFWQYNSCTQTLFSKDWQEKADKPFGSREGEKKKKKKSFFAFFPQ